MKLKPMRAFVAVLIMTFGLAGAGTGLAGQPDGALAKALSGVDLFSELTDAQRDSLAPAARLHRGKAGERLIRQGSAMGRMLVVLDGEADVRIDGKSFVTLTGQVLLGEIEFLDGRPATADVVLLKAADYIVLDNAELNRIMEAHPRIGYLVMREIARIEAKRLRRTSTQ